MDRDAMLRKIQNLLNVAADGSGATDGEVQNALTMARKLMAKHNIEMSELVVEGKLESHEEDTGIMFNTRYCLWKLPLATVMAKHCACEVLLRRTYRSKNSKIIFIGEKDNPKIVREMFKYAVLHVENQVAQIHWSNLDCGSDYRYSLSDSYAKGFIDGLRKQYQEQDKKDPGMALMVVRPASIDEYFEKMNVQSRSFESNTNRFHSSSKYNEGYSQGLSYGHDRLGESQMSLEGVV